MALRTTLNLRTFSPQPPKENLNSNAYLNLAYKKSPLGFFLRARTLRGEDVRHVTRLLRCTRVNGRVIKTEDPDSDGEEEEEEKPRDDPFRMDADERREWQRKVHEMMKNGGPAPDDDVDEDFIGRDRSRKTDPSLPSEEERREWRKTIRETMDKRASEDEIEIENEDERSRKAKQLMSEYPLVVNEEDPNWPDDADGWGFKLDSFFDKITIKNKPKNDDDDVDKEEIVWQDDNYIRPIKDIITADWEEAVFKDFSPLVVLVHHRYKRPKESEKSWDFIEKAVNIIWNCRMPSPRCVAVDAVVETDLVSALRVSVFPEIIFTKAGKILYRERAIRTADELSKMMAYFYYGAHRPACLKITADDHELIPSVTINSRP